MSDDRIQDFFDNAGDGHIDTREANFKCDSPDPNLGCDLGVDVQG